MAPNYNLVSAENLNPWQRELVLPDSSVEIYSPLTKPSESQSLVSVQEKTILRDLNLGKLETQLDLSADLAFLAYNGVIGQGALAADVSDCQKGLEVLCAVVVRSLMTLQAESGEALGYIYDSFGELVKGNEFIALEMLTCCNDNAEKMSHACSDVEVKVKKLQSNVRKVTRSIHIRIADTVKEKQKLEKNISELEANKASQEATAHGLQQSIAELMQDYIQATQEEDDASKQELTAAIVGFISGAVGAGIGKFVEFETMGLDGPKRRQEVNDTKKDGDSEKKDVQTGSKEAESEEIKKSNEVEPAKKTKPSADRPVGQRSEPKEAAALKATSTSSEEKAKILTQGDTDTLDSDKSGSASEKMATNDPKDDGSKPETETGSGAKKKISAIDKKKLALSIAKGTGKGAVEAQKQADIMVSNAKTALERAKIRRAVILEWKWDQEAKNREALGTVAELVSLIKYKENVESKLVLVLSSLETAKWALDNLNNCLADAKMFWFQMKQFCDTLSSPNVVKRLRKMVSDDAGKKGRIDYYKSDAFVTSGIEYTTAWAALNYICTHYQAAVGKARTKINGNIAKSPTIGEASGQINDLRSQVEAKVVKLRADSDVRIKELTTQRNSVLARDLGVQIE